MSTALILVSLDIRFFTTPSVPWLGSTSPTYKDTDGDGIPDKVEEKAAEVKTKARRVKKELKDVVKEVKDVKDAVVGEKKPKRRGRPRKK